MTPTVWVLGDQLHRSIASLADRSPGECRVLLVESEAKLDAKRWHVQRLHVVLSAMAHFAAELEAEGFEVSGTTWVCQTSTPSTSWDETTTQGRRLSRSTQ